MTSMTDKGRFAHLLYRAMESKGLNQKALSERSGVHQSQISRYTNFNPQQQRIPSYETLMDLIDALDCGEAERSELVIGAGYSAYDSRLEGAAEQVDQIATNTAEIKSHTSEILGILRKQTHFREISISCKLIRWKQMSEENQPFGHAHIRVDDIPKLVAVYDKSVIQRRLSGIERSGSEPLQIETHTSGMSEILEMPENSRIDLEAYRRNGRVKLWVIEDHKKNDISVVQRTYNGFQPGNEDLTLTIPGGSTADRLRVEIDFSDVIPHFAAFQEPVQALYRPSFQHQYQQASVEQIGSDQVWRSKVMAHTSYSRLRLFWALKEKQEKCCSRA